jgi:hypothetical protein
MFRLALAALLTAAVFIVSGCSESGDPTDSAGSFDAAALFGLEDGRRLVYLQTDTVVNEDFSVTVTTSFETVNLQGQGADWVISRGDTALINLKLTSVSILQNGHWYRSDEGDSLRYFAVPPVAMAREVSIDEHWQGYTPHFFDGDDNVARLWYHAYFGFYFTKDYLGRQLLHLPAGSFETYHFETGLYQNPIDGTPDVTVQEYYVPSLGPVQFNYRGTYLNRTLSLVSYE